MMVLEKNPSEEVYPVHDTLRYPHPEKRIFVKCDNFSTDKIKWVR